MVLIIKPKNKFVAPLHILARLALRYIYARESMKPDEIDLMHNSIVSWTKKIDLAPIEAEALQIIGKNLYDDEAGLFEDRKETFAKHGISWAAFHRTPELERFVK